MEGLRAQIEFPGDVLYAKGANISNDPVQAERAGYIDIDSRSPAELIAEAVTIAEQSDVVIAALGESKEMSGEASSRADIGIPTDQRPLLEALIATGKPVVLVVFTGRPLTLEWEAARVDAMLVAWFGGTEAGNGIADVLTGRHTPSGKLSVSFPRHVGQIPVYYAHKRTGRPASGTEYEPFRSSYLDVPTDPLFPFGHGLSYTRFEYGEVTIHPENPSGVMELTVRVRVSNVGECAGEETVQLYVSDPAASVTRPVRELKGFQKVHLEPGETKELLFTLTTRDLMFVNADLEWGWEPGEFEIHLGGSSQTASSCRFLWDA
jgi:beta-glucosidase